MRAFWTYNPVSLRNLNSNKHWLFDKSVWQRTFRGMSEAGFNAMFFCGEDPLSFMIDLAAKNTRIASATDNLQSYQEIFQWIFENARDYDIEPYIGFPSGFIPGESSSTVAEYKAECVESLLKTYPDIAGIITSVESGLAQGVGEFVREAIVRPAEAARSDIKIIIRTDGCDLQEMLSEVVAQTGRTILFSVKYTGDHLVHSQPDPLFRLWTERAGAKNVIAEIHSANFEPFTSFSFETASGIIANLKKMKCGGYLVFPISEREWPHTSDHHFKFQFQRDYVLYSVWGGAKPSDLIAGGSPQWIKRQKSLLPGFQAASRILETVALYFGGNKDKSWRPQFCTNGPSLFSVKEMLNMPQGNFQGKNWWKEIIGQPVAHPGESSVNGEFDAGDFINYLEELAAEAESAVEIGNRRAPSEKGLECFLLNAACQAALGRFWAERTKAVLALAADNNEQMIIHLEAALGHYRRMAELDSEHRSPFYSPFGKTKWGGVISALECELRSVRR